MANIYGIDIGAWSVKVAVVEKTFRRQTTIKLVRRLVPIAGDEAGGVDVAARILRDHGYDPDEDHVAMVFPADRLTWRVVTFPFTSKRLIKEALPFEIEAVTPFDADDIVVDFSPLSSGEKSSTVFAVVTLKSDIDPFIFRLKEAGIEPDVVIPHPAVFVAPDLGTPGADVHIHLDIGFEQTAISLVRGGNLAGFHCVTAGIKNIFIEIDSTEDVAEKLLADESLIDEEKYHAFTVAMTTLSKRISAEIKSLASTAIGDQPWPPDGASLTLSGGGASSDLLMRRIADSIGLPGELISCEGSEAPIDDDRLSRRNVKPETFAAASLAANLYATWSDRPSLNLMTGAHAKARRLAGSGVQSIIAAALGAVVIVMALVSFGMEVSRLNGKYDNLKTEIRAQFVRALPDVTTIVSEIPQLITALDELRRNPFMSGSGPGGGDPFLDRFYDLSNAYPDDVPLDIDRMVYESKSVLITGRTESFEKVEQLKKNLTALAWTKKVTVKNAKASTISGGVGFTLMMEIGQ